MQTSSFPVLTDKQQVQVAHLAARSGRVPSLGIGHVSGFAEVCSAARGPAEGQSYFRAQVDSAVVFVQGCQVKREPACGVVRVHQPADTRRTQLVRATFTLVAFSCKSMHAKVCR